MALYAKTPAPITAAGLESKVKATLNAFTTAISSLNGVIANATSAITKHQATITSLQTEISALEEQKAYASKVAEKLTKLMED